MFRRRRNRNNRRREQMEALNLQSPINDLNCHVIWLMLDRLDVEGLLNFERATDLLEPIHSYVHSYLQRKFKVTHTSNLNGFGLILKETKQFLEIVGPYIEDFTIVYKHIAFVLAAYEGPEFLTLMEKYCANLKHLRCYEEKLVNLTGLTNLQLPNLQNLQTLELHNMWSSGFRFLHNLRITSNTLTTLVIDNSFVNYYIDGRFAPDIVPRNLVTIVLKLKRNFLTCLHSLCWFFVAISMHTKLTTISLTYMNCSTKCMHDQKKNTAGYLKDWQTQCLLKCNALQKVYLSCNLIADYHALKRISPNYAKIELVKCCEKHYRRLFLVQRQ